MKLLLAAALAALSLSANAADAAAPLTCSTVYVNGVAGAAQNVREYLASPNRYRYLADNPINCRVSDEGRASACTGITTVSRERASVYDDDADDALITVSVRVELDRGTYPVIVAVPRTDVRCAE
jgi:hypothetical protein